MIVHAFSINVWIQHRGLRGDEIFYQFVFVNLGIMLGVMDFPAPTGYFMLDKLMRTDELCLVKNTFFECIVIM